MYVRVEFKSHCHSLSVSSTAGKFNEVELTPKQYSKQHDHVKFCGEVPDNWRFAEQHN
jgi:hypothetical protein